MTRPTFLPGARADLIEAVGHYRTLSPKIASGFLAELRTAIRLIYELPQASPRARGDVRKKSLRRYPYSLLYSVEGDEVLIVAVAHHRRRPDYWHDRVR